MRRITFFSELSDFDLHQIEGITVEKSFDREEVIVREGTAAESFFIICRGKIEITKSFEDSEDFILGVHSDGEFFGEMALLDEGPRSASARALEPTTILEISRSDFESLLYTAPVLAYTIMKELSARLRQTGALLVSHLQRKNRQLQQSCLDAVSGLRQALEDREPGTGTPAERVTRLALEIGRELGLAEEELIRLEITVLRHVFGDSGRSEEGEARLPALIAGLAAAFDELTRDRPHRGKTSRAEAARLVMEGERLEPRVAEAFRKVVEDRG